MRVERGQRWKHLPSGDIRTVIDIVPYYVAAGCPIDAVRDEYRREAKVARLARVRASDGFIARDCRDSSDMLLNSHNGGPYSPDEWESLPSGDTKEPSKQVSIINN